VGGGFRSGRPGPIELWAADRAAHRVYGLDPDGIVVLALPVLAPVRVAPVANGLVRVLSAVDRWAGGRFETVELDADGRIVRRRPAEAPRALPKAPGDAFTPVLAPPGLAPATACMAAAPAGDRIRRAWVARPALVSTPAATFVERWLERGRGPELGVRVRAPGAAGLLVGAAQGAVWSIATRRLHVTSLDDRGRTRWSREVRDAEGACAVAPARGGGAWIAARGAIVRLDADGRRLPGQGGFSEVVDVARALDATA